MTFITFTGAKTGNTIHVRIDVITSFHATRRGTVVYLSAAPWQIRVAQTPGEIRNALMGSA